MKDPPKGGFFIAPEKTLDDLGPGYIMQTVGETVKKFMEG